MRWYWIDRFEKFVSGVEATTLKNVTLAEEALDDYCPGFPHFSHSLIIEATAQTGGLLLAQTNDFLDRIVLAKVGSAEFQCIARPGDQIRITAKLLSKYDAGAICSGHVEVNGQPQGEIQLTFAILDESYGDQPFFLPSDLCRLLRAMRLFDVGVNPDGTAIKIPEHMLEAELAALTEDPQ